MSTQTHKAGSKLARLLTAAVVVGVVRKLRHKQAARAGARATAGRFTHRRLGPRH